MTVASGRVHSGRLLLRFAEVPDRTAAETLRGTLLLATSREPLGRTSPSTASLTMLSGSNMPMLGANEAAPECSMPWSTGRIDR